MGNYQNNKNPLGKCSSGWRLWLLLLFIAIFMAGIGNNFEEINFGTAAWYLFLIVVGFLIGDMAANSQEDKPKQSNVQPKQPKEPTNSVPLNQLLEGLDKGWESEEPESETEEAMVSFRPNTKNKPKADNETEIIFLPTYKPKSKD